MARSRRRLGSKKERGPSDGIKGAALALVGLLMIGGLGGAFWWLKATRPVLDATTNCPVDGPRAVHLILIDRSDPISGQQAQRIRQTIDHYKNDADVGTRFDIYVFEGDSSRVLDPVLTICSPKRAEEASSIDENVKKVRRRYEERFSAVIDRAIDQLVQESVRPSSPIMESIRAATLTSFGPLEPGLPLRVTLVSDMIQHSDAVSQYKQVPDFAALSASALWNTLRPEFKGAQVEILYLLRPDARRGSAPIQNRGHQLFWEEYCGAGGGRLTRIEPF